MEVPRRKKYEEDRPVAIHSAISNAQNNRSPRHSKTEEKENGSLRKTQNIKRNTQTH
mgnify:FL=1